MVFEGPPFLPDKHVTKNATIEFKIIDKSSPYMHLGIKKIWTISNFSNFEKQKNCRFSSHFFGGRFLASLATWFGCHLDACLHTDGPALRALPKDSPRWIGFGFGGGTCMPYEGSEEFFGDLWMFKGFVCLGVFMCFF